MLVRDGIMSRIKVMPFFAGFNFSVNKTLQIQPTTIPLCGVYILQEMSAPEGDADAGEIRFRTAVRYGFSVIIQNNDHVAGEYTLDKAYQAITIGLFSDPTFYNNKSFRIQGFTSGTRQHFFGSVGLDNETPIAELRYELVADLGTITYPPIVEDDLEVIHEETIFPIDGDASQVQQVKLEYDLEE